MNSQTDPALGHGPGASHSLETSPVCMGCSRWRSATRARGHVTLTHETENGGSETQRTPEIQKIISGPHRCIVSMHMSNSHM